MKATGTTLNIRRADERGQVDHPAIIHYSKLGCIMADRKAWVPCAKPKAS